MNTNVISTHTFECGCTTPIRVCDCPVAAIMCEHGIEVFASTGKSLVAKAAVSA